MTIRDELNERRIFGGTQDVVKLHPVKYKWAMEAYHTANANFWLPQEIQMQKDIEQWPKLTDNERHVIETSLGFFTTADSLVANNLVLLVYKHVSAPELRMYLLAQAFQEAIHILSYQHIVESIGMDEERIFQAYKTIEPIFNKDNFVTKVSETLAGQTIDHYQFYEALFDFYIIMEGVFFYSSFAAIMSFKRRNLLPGTVEQFQYIMRDEAEHLLFGIKVLNAMKEEFPQYKLHANLRYKMKKAVAYEKEYAEEMLGKGLLGINVDTYHQYIEYTADRRLEALGIGALFNQKNPFPWMSELVDLRKQKNFFESRVTEYQQGGLTW